MALEPCTCTVQVFHGPAAEGNLHRLIYTPQAPDHDFADANAVNLIQLWGPPAALQVSYSNRGQIVRRCGSGTLAVAAFVGERCALQARSGRVEIGFDTTSAYYLDTPLPQRPLPAIPPWQRILGRPVIDGCYCGGRGEYVLLEVATPLRDLQPRLRALCQLSRRALIVLHRRSANSVELRYFAPQYGPAEDAATGSASVQAAAYLQRRYGVSTTHILQRSPAGGLLQAQRIGRQVRIRGRTRLTDLQAGQ
ncbi:PhzF family phenazine biosynthesis protein [Aliidiomarina sp. Khilg15.8]